MKTGIIGVGAMGSGMALRLKERGHEVRVRDTDPTREQAMAAHDIVVDPTPAALMDQSDVVLIVVVTAEQINDVLSGPHGLLAAINDSNAPTVFLCSTIAPGDTERFAAQLTQAGARVIDAPISGGPARARDGSMSIMLAAHEEWLTPIQSLIDDLAARQFRISSRAGDGARAKLVNNLAAGVNLAVAAEALAMAERVGLDPNQMCELMTASSAQSWAADDRMPRALADDFEPRAATRVLTKDLTLAARLAEEAGAAVPLGRQALLRYRAACEAGFAEEDDAAMLKYYKSL